MSNKTINEGNKLIAEFMGIELLYYSGESDMVDIGRKIISLDKWARYHTSWDWLMPVVEKIETLTAEDGRGEVNYIVSIEDKSCIISQGGEGELVFVQSEESKIDATWKACIDFIKQHN